MRRSLGKMSSRTRNLGMAQRRLSVAQQVHRYAIGDRVALDHQSQFDGMPHPRYRGKVGTIVATRGKSYEIEVMDGRMLKLLIVPGVHLRIVRA